MLDKADVDSLGSAPMHDTSAMNPVKINKELSQKLRDLKAEIKQIFTKTCQSVLTRVEDVEQHVVNQQKQFTTFLEESNQNKQIELDIRGTKMVVGKSTLTKAEGSNLANIFLGQNQL